MKELLKEAIETGEIIQVHYFGGSKPGSVRKISPVKILDDKVRARCIETGAVKTFIIAKMEIYIPGVEPTLKVEKQFTLPEFRTISEIFDYSKYTLESQGWVVRSNETQISLHSKFKNGNLRKTPEVSLDFEEFEFIFPEPDYGDPNLDWDELFEIKVIDGDALEEAEKKPRTRPWIVRAKSKDTITYGKSSRALKRFMEWSEELAPVE